MKKKTQLKACCPHGSVASPYSLVRFQLDFNDEHKALDDCHYLWAKSLTKRQTHMTIDQLGFVLLSPRE